MNYLHIDKSSIADGLGVRTVLWVSGCTVGCKGCQNPESWDFNAGKPFDRVAFDELLEAIGKPYIRGLTISGGHPLEDQNVYMLLPMICLIRKRYPEKDIWLYTGYKWEDIMTTCKTNFDFVRQMILKECDIVVDGKYDINKHDSTLAFRGSANQRIINVKKSLEASHVVLYDV